jgi:hypothetical protein
MIVPESGLIEAKSRMPSRGFCHRIAPRTGEDKAEEGCPRGTPHSGTKRRRVMEGYREMTCLIALHIATP